MEEITITGTTRAWKLTLSKTNSVMIFFTSQVQNNSLNLSSHLSYIISCYANGTTTSNFQAAFIGLPDNTSSTIVAYDPNRGSTTKYPAWFFVYGIAA